MDYKKEYERELLENSKQAKYMLMQARMIEKMADTINLYDIDNIVCENVENCNESGNPSNNVCRDCIIKHFRNEVEKELEEKEKKVGKVLIFNNNNRAKSKIWINGEFFGCSDDIECLIWDSFKLQEEYGDLDFTYIDADDFDDETDWHAFNFLCESTELDSMEFKLMWEKNFYGLYKYHKSNEVGDFTW